MNSWQRGPQPPKINWTPAQRRAALVLGLAIAILVVILIFVDKTPG